MIDAAVHGVALVKVSETQHAPVEFYAVFLNGTLQRSRFDNWAAAHRHFEILMRANHG